jgi:dihydroxy-acid dehydratase
LSFSGKAIVFENERTPRGNPDGRVMAGHVIVIRHEGPVGGPECGRCFRRRGGDGQGSGKEVALITDGDFSGGSHGFVVGLSLLSGGLGPLAIVQNAIRITIDGQKRLIELPSGKRDCGAVSPMEATNTALQTGSACQVMQNR